MKQKLKSLQRLRLRLSRRAIATAIAFCIPIVIGWYSGYDMLARGEPQGLIAVYAVALAVVTWTCPIWPKEQSNGQ